MKFRINFKFLFSENIILVFSLLFALNLNAQIQRYNYAQERKSKIYNYDFTSTRTFESDSIFNDSGLLCSDETDKQCSITFKKIDLTWYVKTNINDWQEFYNPVENLIKVVYFRNEKFILKPIGHGMEYNGVKLIGFEIEKLYVYSSHNSILWFDPRFGVVIIEGNEMLIREDFKK